jgi:hypothetical protein
MDKLFEMLKKLISDKFYGIIEIHFEAGKIVYLKQVKTIKLKD